MPLGICKQILGENILVMNLDLFKKLVKVGILKLIQF
jgi:hypothetical protein